MSYDLSDTIVAVSSASGGVRSIVRITGPQTVSTCERILVPSSSSSICNVESEIWNRAILSGSIRVGPRLAIDARLYVFLAPRSYTGEDLAEIHIDASHAVVEALVQGLLAAGLRLAGPGEFTARAYLNGKLDLAQAEAVNEIITSSNRLQLDAAERLLSGRLTKAADQIRAVLLDVLSLIEAGLDFSTEDIEFIRPEQAAAQLADIRTRLEQLLAGSIRYETLMDLPAVGIAGAPNAGKSSLLNALLGWERSIVSGQARTTRDVLSGVLTTDRFQCVLFDCAGLIPTAHDLQSRSPIDELAQQAAIEALQNCHTVVFCVDLTKRDWSEDAAVRTLIRPKTVICVATKSDLLPDAELSRRVEALAEAFNTGFLAVSANMSRGLDSLLDAIEASVAERAVPTVSPERGQGMVGTTHPAISEIAANGAALTARHRQAIADAMESLRQAIDEINRGNDEIAVAMIRAACQAISQIEQQHIDEQVLDRIFSRFCVGK